MNKALIFGATSGLGEQVAIKLHGLGAKIVNLSRSPSPYENISVDLQSEESVLNAISLIKQNHADFNVIILNAGIMPLGKLGEMQIDLDALFHVNITHYIRIINDLTSIIKKNKADIVCVGSTASLKGVANHAAYCASKYAVRGFVQSLQVEFANEGIRVIGFYPGGFNSNLRGGKQIEGYMDPEDLAAMMVAALQLPKTMEVSEIVINRIKQQ